MLQEKLTQHFARCSRVYRDELAAQLELIGEKRERQVPSAFFRVLGAALDWPDWFFEGTAIEIGRSLSRFISQADDLAIFANVLDHIGPEQLLASMAQRSTQLNPPRTQIELSTAPTFALAVRHAAEMMRFQTPLAQITLSDRSERLMIVSIESDLNGPLAEVYEFALLLFFVCLANVYPLELASSGPPGMQAFHVLGGRQSWRQAVRPHLPAATHFRASRHTLLQLPSAWCNGPNPYYDEAQWTEAEERLARLHSSTRNVLLLCLDGQLRDALKAEQRVPSLMDVAQELGISERTLSRRLADLGTSYQSRVDHARAAFAENLLQDSHRSIASIARALGFSHSSSFARAFASWKKLSPREWRVAQTSSTEPFIQASRR